MRLHFLLFPILLLIASCDSGPKEHRLEDCENGLDDDGDGLTDCLDTTCADFGGCQPLNNVNNTNPGEFSLVTLPGLRLGINKGHRNVAWNDQQTSELASRVGVNSSRISLPMAHLETWGYSIERADIQYYRDHGIDRHLVAFLTKPTAECSTAPAGTEDWRLVHYMPAGLYEPIWLGDGEINPANCWARYVHQTVSTYHDLIDIWEIWNEPDWVADWRDTLTWWDGPPTAGQLVRFNGDIFHYIRMLRVSAEVIRAVDPEALVATGGLGYPAFVDALMRYTDNPADGSVTAAYPHRGGHWFDVHAIHYYPIFGGGNSDRGVDGFLDHLEAHLAVLRERAAGPKVVIVTESGAPHVAVDGAPGGAAYARNYLMKLVAVAAAAGVSGVDWFLLTDTAPAQDPGTSFEVMGLYYDTLGLVSPADAVPTETGVAHATVGALLGDAVSVTRLDGEVTGEGFEGIRVTLADRRAFVLWAVAGEGEDATTTVSIAGSRVLKAFSWDYAEREEATWTFDPGAPVTLTSSPVVVVEQ